MVIKITVPLAAALNPIGSAAPMPLTVPPLMLTAPLRPRGSSWWSLPRSTTSVDLMRQTVPWAAAQWFPTSFAALTTPQSVLPPLLTALDQTLLFVTSCTILCEFCSITSQNTILILKPILIISLKFLSPVITCVHLTVGDFISSNYLNNRARGENQYFCRLSS